MGEAFRELTGDDAELLVIADNEVSYQRGAGEDGPSLGGRRAGIGAIIDVEDDGEPSASRDFEGVEGRAARRLGGRHRSRDDERAEARPVDGLHVSYIDSEVRCAVAVNDVAVARDAALVDGERGAGLAPDAAHMRAVDAVVVELSLAIAAHRVVGHAGEEARRTPSFT